MYSVSPVVAEGLPLFGQKAEETAGKPLGDCQRDCVRALILLFMDDLVAVLAHTVGIIDYSLAQVNHPQVANCQ